MKQLLYVIHYIEDKAVEFKVAQIIEETETEYILLDYINIGERTTRFPKEFLDKEFEFGYVTLKKDKELFKEQLKRVHHSISNSNKYYENFYRDAQKKNDVYYKNSIDLIDYIKL